MRRLLQVADAESAFDQVYTNQEESNYVWVAFAALEVGRTANQQVAILWYRLGSRKSPALLKLAIERKSKQKGD